MRKHDIHSSGFDVSPEQLAHDLAVCKLQSLDIAHLNEYEVYDRYTELLDKFDAVIQDKIRYDSNITG